MSAFLAYLATVSPTLSITPPQESKLGYLAVEIVLAIRICASYKHCVEILTIYLMCTNTTLHILG